MWTDNKCTGVTILTGDLDGDRKVLTLTSDNVNLGQSATSANKPKVRQVIRWTGPSTFVTEVYKSGDSGSEDKQMVITFTKRDAGAMGTAPTSTTP